MTGSKVTKDTFSETMDEQDSSSETFALWVVNTKVTKVNGSDQFTIVESLLAGKAQINFNKILWGKWTRLQVCKQGCNTVKGIYTTKQSVDLPGLSIRLCGCNGNANDNHLYSSQSDRGTEVSLGTGRMYIPL